MKINQQTVSVIGVLLILTLILIRGPIINWKTHDFYEDDFTLQETSFTEINAEINAAKQKLENLNYKKDDLIGDDVSFSGWAFDNIGLGKLKKKGMYFSDSVTYLQLGNIGVNINEEIGSSFLFYYEKDGQGYLSRTKLIGNNKETTETYNNGKLINSTGNKVIFINKKVNYKYSYRNKSMLVSLTSKFTEVIATIGIYLLGFCQFALSITIFAFFLRFLMFIARNNAFEKGNIQRLKWMSIGFFILAVHKYVIYGIIYLIFISSYSSEGVVMNYSFWDNDYLVMSFAILCYLIYSAFKQGMILKQEQDLTI
jgi:hypothetical protein